MLEQLTESLRGLLDAAAELQADAPKPAELEAIVARGDFRPAEDEAIGFWFARFLTVRESLWAVIDEVLAILDGPLDPAPERHELRHFLLGYAAVCLLVRLDRLMLFGIGNHSIIQRKLNEPFPEYRIARKQYTLIFSAFVDQANVLAIREAMRFAERNRPALTALRGDPELGFLARELDALEASLNPSARSHVRRAWAYVSHKWRRRGVVSASNVLAAVMEAVGRAASEIAELKNKAVTAGIRVSIGGFLEPGDVIITRHAKALTNLFIPGFWPHAALYIGTRDQWGAGVPDVDARIDRLWAGGICVLEARKDGVRLRPLADTLAVDKFVVLRPNLDRATIRRATGRALLHTGKPYKFDFDFFSSDRVVCTEVIYRAYDGLGDLEFPLRERAGRKTLSAEDLIDYALASGTFSPVAIFGVEGCEEAVRYDDGIEAMLIASYRR
jgi:hypothetical protein